MTRVLDGRKIRRLTVVDSRSQRRQRRQRRAVVVEKASRPALPHEVGRRAAFAFGAAVFGAVIGAAVMAAFASGATVIGAVVGAAVRG
jgi:hypothetical protein